MAAGVYEVFGNIRVSSVREHCPGDLKGRSIELSSSDGVRFNVLSEAACISNKIRSVIMAKGLSFVYPLPLKANVVRKLLEYFKHHMEVPAGEVSSPLASVDLVECGASLWDARWIHCDKRMIFELMLAGSLLDIPSLVVLTTAKATAMAMGKSPQQLQREFGMLNDGAAPPKDGESALCTVLLSGLLAAAERNGVLAALKTEAPAPSTVDLRSWRSQSWRAAVLQDWRLLEEAPEEVQGDRDLLVAAMRQSAGRALQHAAARLRSDRALVLEAVRCGPESLQFAAPALRTDRAFVLSALAVDGAALAGASGARRADRGLILEACRRGRGRALGAAAAELRGDEVFVLTCVSEDPEAFAHASRELRESPAFALAAARRRGAALQFMPARCRADPEIAGAAAAQDRLAGAFAHCARREELRVTWPWDARARAQAERAQREAATRRRSMPGGPRHAPLAATPAAGPRRQGAAGTSLKLECCMLFSALSTTSGSMGQNNYVAANIFLERLPPYHRPQLDSVVLVWGAVGHIGMRWKAFASTDALRANPELLLNIADASRVLRATCVVEDVPEMIGAAFVDEYTRHLWTATEGRRRGGWLPGQPVMGEAPPTTCSASSSQTGSPGDDREQQVVDGQRQQKQQERDEKHEDQWSRQGRPTPQEEMRGNIRSDENVDEEGPPSPLVEGARVEIVGLQSKNGWTGTLLKQTADGRWKVRLDGVAGVALLRGGYLRVAWPPDWQPA